MARQIPRIKCHLWQSSHFQRINVTWLHKLKLYIDSSSVFSAKGSIGFPLFFNITNTASIVAKLDEFQIHDFTGKHY